MSIFDKIGASVPLNRQAALSSSKGDHFVSIKKLSCESFADCPPVRKTAVDSSPQFVDFTGKSCGLFRVLGVWDGPKREDGSIRWVLRCVCGSYELKTSRALKRGLMQRCAKCEAVEKMRRHGDAVVKGYFQSRPIEDFVAQDAPPHESIPEERI